MAQPTWEETQTVMWSFLCGLGISTHSTFQQWEAETRDASLLLEK